MKMVKSLLLVSAAGIVAASGAQAADLPVKAKPVEYVKVCSLYGAGFYYIPGTDICLKVGGYVRYQVSTGVGSSPTSGPFAGAAGWNNRINDDNVVQRARAIATFDSRQQTAYGTLRTYLLLGFSQDTNAGPTSSPGLYGTRAFIQIAGFTLGKATSFFDFVSSAAVAYNAGMTSSPDTGDAGQIVASYTAQLGNGLSATIGIEQSKRTGTLYLGTGGTGAGNTALTAAGFAGGTIAAFDNFANGGTGTTGASTNPDIVGNIRIDQAWGAAQLSAAAHDVSGGYYGNGVSGAGVLEPNGHPGNKWGWAASAGLRLNAPMIGPGDYFQVAAVYSEGAFGYASNTWSRTAAGAGQFNLGRSGQEMALGVSSDAVFGNSATTPGAVGGNDIELTTAWSAFASYEHFWTPALRTSLYGSYLRVEYNGNAQALMCSAMTGGGILVAGTTCDNNWTNWNIGSRSQWNVTKDFYVGLDVMYNRLEGATFANAATATPIVAPGGASGVGPAPGSNMRSGNQDAWVLTWRAHRDIVP
jgi:hypothetical protein